MEGGSEGGKRGRGSVDGGGGRVKGGGGEVMGEMGVSER